MAAFHAGKYHQGLGKMPDHELHSEDVESDLASTPNFSPSPVFSYDHPPRFPSYFVQTPSGGCYAETPSPATVIPSNKKSSNVAAHDRPLPPQSNSRFGFAPAKGIYYMWTPTRISSKEADLHSEVEEFTNYRAKRICLIWIVLLAVCILLLGAGLLITWRVFLPRSLSIAVQHVSFQQFVVGQGQDASGVQMQVLSMHATFSILLSNPCKFFGIHVSGGELNLISSGLTVATGQIQELDLHKNSQRKVSAVLSTKDVPLYGIGTSVAEIYNAGAAVQLETVVLVRSKANVLWKIISPTFANSESCRINLDTGNHQVKQKVCSNTL